MALEITYAEVKFKDTLLPVEAKGKFMAVQGDGAEGLCSGLWTLLILWGCFQSSLRSLETQ